MDFDPDERFAALICIAAVGLVLLWAILLFIS